ncbi:hypothetical protein HDU77_009004 [Chytriomyces hyalinus]|nr:hypothetical protein HDU77_009004 [Chytriomyces hyalinus]
MQSDITAKVKSYFLHTVSQYPIKVPTARITAHLRSKNWGAHIDSYTDDQLKAYNKEVQRIFGVERDKMVKKVRVGGDVVSYELTQKKIKGKHNRCGLTSNGRTKLALYAVQLFDVAAVQNDDAQKRAALLRHALQLHSCQPNTKNVPLFFTIAQEIKRIQDLGPERAAAEIAEIQRNDINEYTEIDVARRRSDENFGF